MEEIKVNIETQRHSLSHVLAQAVQRLKWAQIQLGVWPDIENGFYYDFDTKIVEEDLKEIQKMMEKIIKENQDLIRFDTDADNAKKILQELLNQKYKLELLTDFVAKWETKISFYLNTIDIKAKDILLKTASAEYIARYEEITKYFKDILPEWRFVVFIDMCEWPHVSNTKELNADAFKIERIAWAYWKWDEKNIMMTRVYGYAFDTKEELKQHLTFLEEAKKRDHKKLGKELDLFSFHQESPWMAFWHPKGMVLWNNLEAYGKSIRKKYGFLEIKTPPIAKNSLWITSWHWDHYKEDMFVFDVDEETYCIKPMDCPFDIKIYQTRSRSYRDLPVLYTEIGRVFRNEKAWQLNGLFRVREITQDDSHVLCTPEQVEQEISRLLTMVNEYYPTLWLTPEFFLSTRPESFIGEIATWDKAEQALANALKANGITKYGIKDKDGAFYWPKIDVNIKDCVNRSWQVATIQLDFQLPWRFDMEYIDKDWQSKTPVMIHAAIFGSFERMIWMLIEHYAGSFPLWLAPVQVKLLPVIEKFNEWSSEIIKKLEAAGLRVELDDSNNWLNKKIRNAELEKIPYIVIIWEKELESWTLSIREYKSKAQYEVSIDEFISNLNQEIEKKILK